HITLAQPSSFSFYSSAALRDLHSFPTRRSSDLGERRLAEYTHERDWQRGGGEADRYGLLLIEDLMPWIASQYRARTDRDIGWRRSEEHTSELQSRSDLVCRLLLEKKNITLLH